MPRRGSGDRRYDAVFYMPWIGPLLRPGAAAPTGGAETQIYLVARALAALGARVGIVAFEVDGGLPSRVDGIDVITRKPYEGNSGGVGRLRELVTTARVLRSLDARVLITRAAGPYVGVVALAARLTRARFVYSSASLTDFTFELEDAAVHRLLYRLGVRLADTVIVQTEEQVLACKKAFGVAPRLIRSIAEPARDASARDPRAFLWVGRLVWYKQPLKFVELAARLHDLPFRMVGVPVPPVDDPLVAEVRRAASELPNLDLLDPRPRPELLALMDEAVAIVNTADFEGMPNIFLEGWARGVPALSLAHDPDSLISRYQLGAFAESSPDGLAQAARSLWDKRTDVELRNRCIRYVDAHHSVRAVGDEWLEVVSPADPLKAAETSHSSGIGSQR